MRDVTLGTTIEHGFTTRAFASGIPTVLAGTPVLSVKEGGNATPITAGVSVEVDTASVVGMNEATIVATAANGYELGKTYYIYISAGTVGGVSVVGEVVGYLTIGQSAAAVNVAYEGAYGRGVWIDDGAANTNTVLGTDGTRDNAVSTIAAATTIASALGSQLFYLVNDTQITLAQTYEGYEFVGIGEITANVITLGSQDVDTAVFRNLLLTGTQGGTGRCQAEGCCLSTITGMEITALRCLLTNSGSLTLRNDCAFDSCFSAVAGNATPTLDVNSVANVNVYFRHYSGGIQIDNAVSTTVMSYEADGQLIIDATCTSLTVVVRGNCSITDNGTTTSLTQDAAINAANIADALLDRADGIEPASDGTETTVREAIRVILAGIAGKVSGAATTNVKFRNRNDTKDVIDATVDADGNRTAVTITDT